MQKQNKMKVSIENNGGTTAYVKELLKNTEVQIGMDTKGVIIAKATFPESPKTTGKKEIVLVKYSGSLNLNSGYDKTNEKPFQMTQGAKKEWGIFMQEVINELLAHIKYA